MVTELWYSIPLSEQTYKYLAKTLEELIEIRSAEDLKLRTSELINIEEDHLKDNETTDQQQLETTDRKHEKIRIKI